MQKTKTIIILTSKNLHSSLQAAAKCNNVYINPKLAETIIRTKNSIQSMLRIIDFEELNYARKISFKNFFFMMAALESSETKLYVDDTQSELQECFRLLNIPHLKTICIAMTKRPDALTVKSIKKIATLTQNQRIQLKLFGKNNQELRGAVNLPKAFEDHGVLNLCLNKQ